MCKKNRFFEALNFKGFIKLLNRVTHNFHLKIRNILKLTTYSVKFGTTCPRVIFLRATGSRATMFEIFMLLTNPHIW